MAGYRILSDILEVSTTAIVNDLQGKASAFDKLILQMLPLHPVEAGPDAVYKGLLQASSFVARLSDGAAVHIHNKISGKQL